MKLMTIGDRLRDSRKNQNLTAKKLSKLSGVPEKTIYRIETGEVKDPKISSLTPLIKALNCSSDEIIFSPNEFIGLGALKQALIKVSRLPELEQNLVLDLVQKICLATAFEYEISRQMPHAEHKTFTKKEKEEKEIDD